MDNKDLKVLSKILEHCNSIINNTKNFKNAKDFKKAEDLSKIALFDLLQIGELAKDGLSEEALKNIKEIKWANMYGLRNRIVHGYASVDYEIIWETIVKDIPSLKEILENYI